MIQKAQKLRKAVFPVGGLGTRFLPATKSMPKEMLTVVDKPLIHYAVEEARAAGIEEFIFVTGRGKGAIEDYFDEHAELKSLLESRGQHQTWQSIQASLPGVGQIAYTRQPEPLGLGHAVWCARKLVGDEPFAVILADILIQSEKPGLQYLSEHYNRSQTSCMIGVMTVDASLTGRYGIVGGQVKGNITTVEQLVEKPDPKNAPSRLGAIGRYILPAGIFDILESARAGQGGEIQLTDAIAAHIGKTTVEALTIPGQHFDCGSKIGFLEANLAFALQRPDMKTDVQRLLAQHSKMAA
ncbi:MAG: UTP--glucose-1-phosphate uridylyltransferase [Alphaproteobacteria bacterium]|nr:MAG: UTP--glucose-1-phosphate uridylyltransferase [Alphaproteobacteria bacterium]